MMSDNDNNNVVNITKQDEDFAEELAALYEGSETFVLISSTGKTLMKGRVTGIVTLLEQAKFDIFAGSYNDIMFESDSEEGAVTDDPTEH